MKSGGAALADQWPRVLPQARPGVGCYFPAMLRLLQLLPALALVVLQTAMVGLPMAEAKPSGPNPEQIGVFDDLGLVLSLCGAESDGAAAPDCPWCHTVKDTQIVPPGAAVPGLTATASCVVTEYAADAAWLRVLAAYLSRAPPV